MFDWLGQIAGFISSVTHPQLVLAQVLNQTIGLVLKVWYGFILSTTDFDTSGEFTLNATIARYEPWVQAVSDAALVLIVMWASLRIMWGHGIRSQYTARILLPRLMMAALLINFALPLYQMAVDASNTISLAVQSFITFESPATWVTAFAKDTNAGLLDIITTGALAAGYDALAIAYVVRYAILIVLAITAPLAGLLFTLPETHHLSKLWLSHFTTNLLMQPFQLFVLAVGFALEHGGTSPLQHLFALATLFIVFKVPGAIGGAEKAAHRLEATVKSAFVHLERGLLKA